MNLVSIQRELQKIGLDGWLFFDHHERDPLAYRVLGLKSSQARALADQVMRETDATRIAGMLAEG